VPPATPQEAGNARARDCLKYVVLANILAQSNINPFAAREAKVYQVRPLTSPVIPPRGHGYLCVGRSLLCWALSGGAVCHDLDRMRRR
jgi:hypothetical protein